MSSRKKKNKSGKGESGTQMAVFHASALQAIRRHAHATPEVEICGVLVGRISGTYATVVGAVPAEGVAHGTAHVTFTQEAWVSIHEEKARRFPDQSIVGWYHSHPGFGVFLSDHDTFIHENFFAFPGSLAWVYDPLSEEEGCFGLEGEEIARVQRFCLVADEMKGEEWRREFERKPPPATASEGGPPERGEESLMSPLLVFAVTLALVLVAGWFLLTHTTLANTLEDWFGRPGASQPSRPPDKNESAATTPKDTNEIEQSGGGNE